MKQSETALTSIGCLRSSISVNVSCHHLSISNSLSRGQRDVCFVEHGRCWHGSQERRIQQITHSRCSSIWRVHRCIPHRRQATTARSCIHHITGVGQAWQDTWLFWLRMMASMEYGEEVYDLLQVQCRQRQDTSCSSTYSGRKSIRKWPSQRSSWWRHRSWVASRCSDTPTTQGWSAFPTRRSSSNSQGVWWNS